MRSLPALATMVGLSPTGYFRVTHRTSPDRSPNDLIVEGARQNNLKNISLRIPHDRVTAITGLSGSGKSSLAFDTLFAEGQWRYVESLSTYARMFLDKVNRPDVDRLVNIRPAIAIEQKNPIRTARSCGSRPSDDSASISASSTVCSGGNVSSCGT